VIDVAVRAAGALVALWGAVLLALIGAFLTPLRIGGTLVPVSILLGIVGNVALIWFAYRVTENKLLGLLPGLVWLGLTFLGVERTTEGDLVLTNWVATVYLYAGAITVGAAAYRMILSGR
jgi:hypothetical protein